MGNKIKPVATNRKQLKVPVPKGLDLDKWIDPAAEQGLGMDDDEPESPAEIIFLSADLQKDSTSEEEEDDSDVDLMKESSEEDSSSSSDDLMADLAQKPK